VFSLFIYLFIFVSVIAFLSRNNALILDFGPLLKKKIHLLGTLRGGVNKVSKKISNSLGKALK